MKDLLDVLTPDQAARKLIENINLTPGLLEEVPLEEALGRIVGEDILSPEDLPGFSRSTMDGYAVQAQDTFGASEGIPGYLTVVGEVLMGEQAATKIGPGQTVKIATGGMLPPGADAVLMLEYTQEISPEMLEIVKGVGPGENTVRRGEDVEEGQVLIKRGSKLRPQDLGALSGLGITQVKVFPRPKVAVISTGDELVPPQANPGPGQIRDINSPAIGAQVKEEGGIPLYLGIVKDDYNSLKEKIQAALGQADLVVISGGSSVGTRDVTLDVIEELGNPGVLVHGVAVRPGKPTILGSVGGKAVFGLPGHPVSAMIIFDIFVSPVIRRLTGLLEDLRGHGRRVVWAKLSRNMASAAGREDHLRVALVEKEGEIWAEPILGKSGLITTMVKAHGTVKIPAVKEGLLAGELVEVILF